jgi:hypothetical protein
MLPPLLFTPLYRRYIWGGRRFAAAFGRPLPPGDDYAESWELVDRAADQSLVRAGPLAGMSLGRIVRERGSDLFGHPPPAAFPLLFKFLDANRVLSVQVHPDDERAARLEPPDRGKTEAWYVVAAEPESRIYAGLREGVGREELAAAIRAGTCEAVLHAFEPSPGDCVFIPAGTVHAIGAGLLVAEIQQSSDVTYRLFDWNRTGPDGRPAVACRGGSRGGHPYRAGRPRRAHGHGRPGRAAAGGLRVFLARRGAARGLVAVRRRRRLSLPGGYRRERAAARSLEPAAARAGRLRPAAGHGRGAGDCGRSGDETPAGGGALSVARVD